MAAAVAAARISRNLIRLSPATPQYTPRFFTFRNQSNNASIKNNPIDDPELESDSTSNLSNDLDHLLALRRIESAMHQILVRKSTPGWLPFVPGGSYWVPPVGSGNSNSVAEMVEKLASSLKKEENAARRANALVCTERGWPSKAYFFKGASPHSIETEINSNNMSHSEDEE